MPTEAALPDDHPLRKSWDVYRATSDYENSWRWAGHSEHRNGSMWAAFMAGWQAATERAASIHENINPASDDERTAGVPGAGAMGAVIEYRDAIRG